MDRYAITAEASLLLSGSTEHGCSRPLHCAALRCTALHCTALHFAECDAQSTTSGPLGAVQPWASVHEKLGFHGPHNHPDSTFSAVYYVDVPVGSGDISFADPRVPTASPLGPTLRTMRHVAMQDGIPCKRKRSAACNMHDHHAGMCARAVEACRVAITAKCPSPFFGLSLLLDRRRWERMRPAISRRWTGDRRSESRSAQNSPRGSHTVVERAQQR